MELTQFIKITLSSIKKGVSEANSESGNVYRINPGSDKIDFDIAVEVAKEKGSEKGGGLAVKVIEGRISGSSSSKESSVSRIKFSVSVSTLVK